MSPLLSLRALRPWDYPPAQDIREDETCMEFREWEESNLQGQRTRYQAFFVIRNDDPAVVVYDMGPDNCLPNRTPLFFDFGLDKATVGRAREKADVMRDGVTNHLPYHYEPTDMEETMHVIHHEETEAAAHRSVSGPHYRKERA